MLSCAMVEQRSLCQPTGFVSCKMLACLPAWWQGIHQQGVRQLFLDLKSSLDWNFRLSMSSAFVVCNLCCCDTVRLTPHLCVSASLQLIKPSNVATNASEYWDLYNRLPSGSCTLKTSLPQTMHMSMLIKSAWNSQASHPPIWCLWTGTCSNKILCIVFSQHKLTL